MPKKGEGIIKEEGRLRRKKSSVHTTKTQCQKKNVFGSPRRLVKKNSSNRSPGKKAGGGTLYNIQKSEQGAR